MKTHTPVIFKKFKDGGDIIALFPTIPWTNYYNVASYQHIGQHGGADISLFGSLIAAKPNEYADLLKDLKSIGYDDLRVFTKRTQRMDKERNAACTDW